MIADIGPWSRLVLRRVVLAQALALVLGGIAWSGANAQDSVRAQIAWLNLGILAAVVAGTAQAWWLLAGRRVVSLQRRAALAGFRATGVAVPDRAPTAGVTTVSHGQRIAIPGSSWHHDAGCLLVKDKAVVVIDEPAELEPCDVCRW